MYCSNRQRDYACIVPNKCSVVLALIGNDFKTIPTRRSGCQVYFLARCARSESTEAMIRSSRVDNSVASRRVAFTVEQCPPVAAGSIDRLNRCDSGRTVDVSLGLSSSSSSSPLRPGRSRGSPPTGLMNLYDTATSGFPAKIVFTHANERLIIN